MQVHLPSVRILNGHEELTWDSLVRKVKSLMIEDCFFGVPWEPCLSLADGTETIPGSNGISITSGQPASGPYPARTNLHRFQPPSQSQSEQRLVRHFISISGPVWPRESDLRDVINAVLIPRIVLV
jgi:hypothetical protein